MDSETQAKIEKTVLEILKTADMADMTEFKVRKEAGEKLRMDLNSPPFKKFIRDIVENFLQQGQEQEQEQEPDDDSATVANPSNPEIEEKEIQENADEEEEEEEVKPQPKKARREAPQKSFAGSQKSFTDDNGELVICKLSGKRNVSVSEFRGKKLVSIREYWNDKPTHKGISLTVDQWNAFKQGLPAIERAIEQLK